MCGWSSAISTQGGRLVAAAELAGCCCVASEDLLAAACRLPATGSNLRHVRDHAGFGVIHRDAGDLKGLAGGAVDIDLGFFKGGFGVVIG